MQQNPDCYPKSNLLKSRTTTADGVTLKQEFFAYDINGTLIEERWFEGGIEHLKVTQPTTKAPESSLSSKKPRLADGSETVAHDNLF